MPRPFRTEKTISLGIRRGLAIPMSYAGSSTGFRAATTRSVVFSQSPVARMKLSVSRIQGKVRVGLTIRVTSRPSNRGWVRAYSTSLAVHSDLAKAGETRGDHGITALQRFPGVEREVRADGYVAESIPHRQSPLDQSGTDFLGRLAVFERIAQEHAAASSWLCQSRFHGVDLIATGVTGQRIRPWLLV